ncbi:MAG TPA: glycosyltransferase family 1 protein [Proteobacteria bacterium]|nr:glycosyltransferase family 1 protein [Pseudomonadota bacterium]
MRVTYVTRSFLDYRIPVFEALDALVEGNLHVIYSADYVPNRVHEKARNVLGERAVGMRGERRIGPNQFTGFSNSAVRIVYQPGLLAEIGKTRPDILIGDGFFQWTGFALLYKLTKRIPLLLCYERTFHTERNAQWFRILYRRFVMKFVDAMSCNGRLSSEYTQWLGMPASRITTGHMVADTDNLKRQVASVSGSMRAELRRRWGTPGPIFLTIGRLIRLKGFQELLRSWAGLERSGAGNSVLLIIGAGPEEEDLRKLAESLNLNSVRFLGAVDYDQIAPYYAAADVFVMPTLEDNWSLVVPEAMACGLPVLCSKYNGCYPELVKPGDNGWVFDPLDEQDTFEALRKCIQNKDRLKQMGEKSREIVSHHTPQTAAKAIYEACWIALKKSA